MGNAQITNQSLYNQTTETPKRSSSHLNTDPRSPNQKRTPIQVKLAQNNSNNLSPLNGSPGRYKESRESARRILKTEFD